MESVVLLSWLKDTIIFWLVWFVIFGLIFWIYNKRLKKSEKLSDKQIQEVIKEKFPRRFGIYYDLIAVISIVGGFAIGGVIFFWLSKLITNRIENMIYFNYSGFSIFLFIMFFLFFGIFLGLGMITSLIALTNPKFGRFVLKRQVLGAFQSGIGSNLRKPSYKKDYRLALILLVLLFVIGTPLLFLAVDNYSYVASNGLTYNSFFSLNEKTLTWDDAVKVEITNFIHEGKLNIHYFINFNDGSRINIWKGSNLKELSQIDDTLRSKNIPFEIEPIDETTKVFINDKYSSDSSRLILVKKILRI